MPEKSIHEVPRPVREAFDRGMAAYQKDNLDYAVALFMDVLQKEPALFECRRALRAAQARRGGRGGLFKRLLGQASSALGKGQLALRSNPADALHSAEQVLNDDPKNQEFCIEGYGILDENFEIYIYNRWGQMVYESTVRDDCWDGNYNNAPAALGTYVYIIRFSDSKYIRHIVKGAVTIFR